MKFFVSLNFKRITKFSPGMNEKKIILQIVNEASPGDTKKKKQKNKNYTNGRIY